MGNTPGRNHEINRRVHQRANAVKRSMQILLLGAGESGKSTILKQTMRIHGKGFSDEMRREYIAKITLNVLSGAFAVYEASGKLGLASEDPLVQKAGERLQALYHLAAEQGADRPTITQQIADDVKLLYNDPTIQKVISQRAKFQLEDTWENFVDKLANYPAWGGPSWIPDDEDILLSRVRTTGVIQVKFQMDTVPFVMIDVGGQKAERRKWMNLFSGVSGVIFVSSLSEYDQTLFEDSHKNRLVESLEIFKQYGGIREFSDAAIMLFLNKYDLFQKKYKEEKIPIPKPYDEAPEPPKEEDDDPQCKKALEWFRDLFLAQIATVSPHREVYFHVTTALSENNIKKVLSSCSSFVLKKNLVDVGLMFDNANLLKVEPVEGP